MVRKRKSFCRIYRCASQKLQLRSKHFLGEFHVHQITAATSTSIINSVRCLVLVCVVRSNGTWNIDVTSVSGTGIVTRSNRRAHRTPPREVLACLMHSFKSPKKPPATSSYLHPLHRARIIRGGGCLEQQRIISNLQYRTVLVPCQSSSAPNNGSAVSRLRGAR